MIRSVVPPAILLMFTAPALMLAAAPAAADEGMWTFDNAPLARINATHGTKLDASWLAHIQASAVRLNIGCSGAAVSPDGLVVTNQHCVSDCARELSGDDHDYVADGFLTTTREDEKTCPGLAADILLSTTDVSKQVVVASHGKTGDGLMTARRIKMTGLEKAACNDDRHFRCQVVSLYDGNQYVLYRYRRYSDVRLVFAPEFQAAFFGGDPDNFNFPRHALDVGFLRLYEDGAPVHPADHLRWTATAPHDGQPVFVAGDPGMTQRQMTTAQLETLRDVIQPLRLAMLSELRGRLIQFSAESDDNRQMAQDTLYDVENVYKALQGEELALRDPGLIAMKRQEDARLRATTKRSGHQLKSDPWRQIAKAQAAQAELYTPYYFLEQSPMMSDLFAVARKLVRAAEEKTKPSADRLPEYADARLPALEADIVSPMSKAKPLEEMIYAFRLSRAREYLTTDTATARTLLGDDSPEHLAQTLVQGTHLDDVHVREALWQGGMKAIRASDDPMIQYALRIDPAARAMRKRYEDAVTTSTRIAAGSIAALRFKAYGTSTYPEATFSPRLSAGTVAGWTYHGATIAPFTTFGGLYARATDQTPYQLPVRFAAARDRLNPDTVFNFATSNDIAAGSSGSPVIAANGDLVGIVFDGNIHSLGGVFSYDGALNRTVAVSTTAVSAALDLVYDNQPLLRELTVGQ